MHHRALADSHDSNRHSGRSHLLTLAGDDNGRRAQPPRSLWRRSAQFLFASLYHHRRSVIVDELHFGMLTDAGSEGKTTCLPDHIGARSSHLTLGSGLNQPTK